MCVETTITISTCAHLATSSHNVQDTAAYPGELFSLGIKALDEIGRPTSDIVRISDFSNKVRHTAYFVSSKFKVQGCVLLSPCVDCWRNIPIRAVCHYFK